MKGYHDNIERATEENGDFRRVLYTGHNIQLVLMSIGPGEEIGGEVHRDRDQFFRFEAGEGEVTVDGNVYAVKADDAVIVPQGARHNVRCTGSEPLKLTPEQERPIATQAIRREELNKIGNDRLKEAKAKAKIEYQKGYEPPLPKEGPAIENSGSALSNAVSTQAVN